jgi:hypothetical protein
MNSVTKVIFIAVAAFILGFATNQLVRPGTFDLTSRVYALEKENTKLNDKIAFQSRVEDVMVHDWVELHSKYNVIEKLDTNGISCTEVVNAVYDEAKGEVANMRITLAITGEWNDTLQAIARRHYELTKDTTLIPKILPETFYKTHYKKHKEVK